MCIRQMIHVCNELRRSTQKITQLRSNKPMSDHLEGISKIPTSLPSRLILEYLIQGNSDFDWSPAEEGSERNEKERIPIANNTIIRIYSLTLAECS